jgi:hypothetical protein
MLSRRLGRKAHRESSRAPPPSRARPAVGGGFTPNVPRRMWRPRCTFSYEAAHVKAVAESGATERSHE